MSEREMFEVAMFKLADGQTKNEINPINGKYMYGVMEVMWQVWQASAQREGYKLVPVQPPNEVIFAIEKKVENQLEASGINQDPFRLDGETIYEAMIGVAE